MHHSYLCGLLNFSFGDFPKRKATLPPGKGVKPLSRGRGVPVQPEMRGKWSVRAGMVDFPKKESPINPINPRDELACSLSLRAKIEHISLNSRPFYGVFSGMDRVSCLL